MPTKPTPTRAAPKGNGKRGMANGQKPTRKAITKLSDLRPQRVNANLHTPRGLGELQKSIQRDGIIGAITVAADGETFDGSARLETLAEIMPGVKIQVVDTVGETQIVNRRLDILSADDPRAKRLGVAANLVQAIDHNPDGEVLALLAAEDEAIATLAKMDKASLDAVKEYGNGESHDAEVDVDRAGELQKKWRTATGQLWTLGEHRLLCGDCTKREDVERVMGGEKADTVFTSPPYAVGVDYGEYKDTIENLRAMLPALSKTFLEIVVDGGFAVINFGDVASGRNIAKSKEPCEYPMALEYYPVFRADGWLLWSRRVWCKPNPRVHSPWCIQSNRAATDWEHLWTWLKPGEPIVKRVDGELRSASGWYQSSQMHGVDIGKDEHGAGMALGISAWMVNVHSRQGGNVFEPFAGTGTTGIACQNLGRKARMIEISPAYVAVCLQRFSDAFPALPIALVKDNAKAKRK